MTAEEIRNNYQGNKPIFDPADAGSALLAQLEIQAEIAAQLAELNGHSVLAIDAEKTAHAIHGGTDFEFGLDQCRRMVQLVVKYGVRA